MQISENAAAHKIEMIVCGLQPAASLSLCLISLKACSVIMVRLCYVMLTALTVDLLIFPTLV